MVLNQYLRLLPHRELKVVVAALHQLETSRKPRKEELISVVEKALLPNQPHNSSENREYL